MGIEDLSLESIRGELDKYFKPPDLSNSFTIHQLMKDYDLGRQAVRNTIDEMLENNVIEYVGKDTSGAYHYRFVEDSDAV